jgi:hypothetical protein
MPRGRQTGRILPFQRDTDDRVPTILADAVINEEHAAAVHTTESQGMKPKTRNEYRNRENHLMVFWHDKYPEYFEQGTVLLTDEEKNDPNTRFHAHGIRKGSGTHASSATTLPPQFTSVAARGEWSMGKILDIYFQFAMGGDYTYCK